MSIRNRTFTMVWTYIILLLLTSEQVHSQHVRQFYEYMFFKRKLTHDKALDVCKSHNSVLAMPKTPGEYAEILEIVGENKVDFWLGLKRDNGEEFQYANGESLVYEGWKNDEPNNEGGRQGCVEGHPWVIDEYQWVDQNCAVLNAYVCQFSVIDSVILTLKNKNKRRRRKGRNFISIEGSYYEAFADKVKYIDAVKSCRAKGGDIAMPKTHEEDRHISDAAKLLGGDRAYWIGVQRVMEQWRWEDGEAQTFSFNSWHSEMPFVQPDNFQGAPENCAQYKQTFHNWNDCPCTQKMAYVCQKTREYSVYKTPVTFDEAVASCKANNSRLVMPKTELEYRHVLKTANSKIRSFWIGLKRGSGSEFYYANGGSLTYQGWYPTGEDFREDDEGCVEGWPWVGGQWHEQNCAVKLHYVCQFINGKVIYKAYLDRLKYIDAVISCRAKGGEIAMPTTFEEDQEILEASKLVHTDAYWIGVQAAMEHWFWLDGQEQTFSYNSWHVDQPDNFKGRQENCAHYKKYLNNWNDVKCSRLYPYICQRYLY